MRRTTAWILFATALALAAAPASAYVGPGAGLSLLGALWGLLLAVIAALSFLVLWPLRQRRRKNRLRREQAIAVDSNTTMRGKAEQPPPQAHQAHQPNPADPPEQADKRQSR